MLRRFPFIDRETSETERNLIEVLLKHIRAVGDSKSRDLEILVSELCDHPRVLHRHEIHLQQKRTSVGEDQRLLLERVIGNLLNQIHVSKPRPENSLRAAY